MTTWTITGNAVETTYAGAGGVDRIDFDATTYANATIAVEDLASFTISGRGTFVSLALLGGPGYDRLFVDLDGGPRHRFDAVTFGGGWSPDDTLWVRGTAANETVWGSGGDDLLDAGGGQDSILGGAGTDTLRVSNFLSPTTVTISGDVISNGAGLLVRFAGIEQFVLELGTGHDSIFGLAGDDALDGGSGNDTLSGGAGDDGLYGGGGRDTLRGTGGDDYLDGGDGDDLLQGQTGADRLNGGAGADTLYGGAGEDSYIIADALDRVVESEGGGPDRIDATVSVDLRAMGGANAGEIEFLFLNQNETTNDLNGTGNAFANSIFGTDGANALEGMGGADHLNAQMDAAVDRIAFRSAAASTGTGHDTVENFDAAAEDRLRVDANGVGVDTVALRSGGSLSGATFDADLAARLDTEFAAGGTVQAMLWDPSAGDRNFGGDRYLVVDLDNDGAYAAGADLVVLLRGMAGTLDIGDFL